MQKMMKLEPVPGSSEARLIPSPRPWFRSVGAHVDVANPAKPIYYIVHGKDNVRCSRNEAEAFALKSLSADAQVAHDIITESAPVEVKPTITHLGAYATALQCLQDFGAEFEVVPFQAAYESAEGTCLAPGYRAIVRKDNGCVLHMSTDAYEIVPQRVALSLLDASAAAGVINYRRAWVSTENQRIRPVGAERGKNIEIEGRRIGITFDMPSVAALRFNGIVRAGGTLVTSHDGSSAIKATAALDFQGTLIFNLDVRSWKHTSKVAERLDTATEALEYLARAARGLVRDAESTINVPDHEAVEIVLKTLAPELFEADPIIGSMPDADRTALIEAKAKKLALSRERLHTAARAYAAKAEGVYLGGFRYVLAAPHFASNRTVTVGSYFDGQARERMTTALLALARHAGVVEAGLVPE